MESLFLFIIFIVSVVLAVVITASRTLASASSAFRFGLVFKAPRLAFLIFVFFNRRLRLWNNFLLDFYLFILISFLVIIVFALLASAFSPLLSSLVFLNQIPDVQLPLRAVAIVEVSTAASLIVKALVPRVSYNARVVMHFALFHLGNHTI